MLGQVEHLLRSFEREPAAEDRALCDRGALVRSQQFPRAIDALPERCASIARVAGPRRENRERVGQSLEQPTRAERGHAVRG